MAKSVPVSDQKGAKTLHRAAHNYMAAYKEEPPSGYSTLDRNPSDSALINFSETHIKWRDCKLFYSLKFAFIVV